MQVSIYSIGQYGEVYKAEYAKGTRSNLTVAVKAIKKYQSQRAHDDFLREMDSMSQFVHPNIVKLYGIVQQGIVNLRHVGLQYSTTMLIPYWWYLNNTDCAPG